MDAEQGNSGRAGARLLCVVDARATPERESIILDYMEWVRKCMATGRDPFAEYGGPTNIQRIRVVETGGAREFVLVPRLPPDVVKRQRAARERELQEIAVKAEIARLGHDPKAREAFIKNVVVNILGPKYVIALLQAMHEMKKSFAKKPQNRRPAPKKLDPYAAALAQDRQNRREASKKAAEEYHANKRKAS